MAHRAKRAFTTAIGGNGRKRQFAKDAVVPDDVAKVATALVYDDGAKVLPTTDGKPPAAHECDECGRDFTTAGGLSRHVTMTHDEG